MLQITIAREDTFIGPCFNSDQSTRSRKFGTTNGAIHGFGLQAAFWFALHLTFEMGSFERGMGKRRWFFCAAGVLQRAQTPYIVALTFQMISPMFQLLFALSIVGSQDT